jgi:hypothetical protein
VTNAAEDQPALHRVSLVRGGEVEWTHVLSERAVAVAATADVVVVAGEHGGVHMLSPLGDRMLPPMLAGGLVALLRAEGPRVTVVTSRCRLHTWNVAAHTCVHRGVDVAPVVADPVSLLS